MPFFCTRQNVSIETLIFYVNYSGVDCDGSLLFHVWRWLQIWDPPGPYFRKQATDIDMLVWLADVCVLYNHDNAGGLMAEATAAGLMLLLSPVRFPRFLGFLPWLSQPPASSITAQHDTQRLGYVANTNNYRPTMHTAGGRLYLGCNDRWACACFLT